MLTVEKVLVLKSVSMFAEVRDEYLVDLAQSMRERAVDAGQVVIAEGALDNSLFIIVDGQVEISRGAQVVACLGEREVFGELAALDPQPRSATVRAVDDTSLLELSHPHLEAALTRDVEIMRGIIRMLCRRLREAGENFVSG